MQARVAEMRVCISANNRRVCSLLDRAIKREVPLQKFDFAFAPIIILILYIIEYTYYFAYLL